MKQTAAITLLLTALGVGALAQSQSSITSLSRKACRELKVDSKDRLLYRGRCPGVGGFKLEIDTGEDQEAVELVSPKGKHFDVSIHPANFTSVGKTVEWRTRSRKPYALIIPFRLRSPDSGRYATSLVVSKISASSACVTDVVEPARNQAVKARKLADSASSRPCRAT